MINASVVFRDIDVERVQGLIGLMTNEVLQPSQGSMRAFVCAASVGIMDEAGLVSNFEHRANSMVDNSITKMRRGDQAFFRVSYHKTFMRLWLITIGS